MAESALRQWWGHLSDTQRTLLQVAAQQCRLDQEPAAQMLADTGCPVQSLTARPTPSTGRSPRLLVVPDTLRRFITDRV